MNKNRQPVRCDAARPGRAASAGPSVLDCIALVVGLLPAPAALL